MALNSRYSQLYLENDKLFVKQEVEKVFANGINVFCTSSPGAISVGVDWLQLQFRSLNGSRLLGLRDQQLRRRGRPLGYFGVRYVSTALDRCRFRIRLSIRINTVNSLRQRNAIKQPDPELIQR